MIRPQATNTSQSRSYCYLYGSQFFTPPDRRGNQFGGFVPTQPLPVAIGGISTLPFLATPAVPVSLGAGLTAGVVSRFPLHIAVRVIDRLFPVQTVGAVLRDTGIPYHFLFAVRSVIPILVNSSRAAWRSTPPAPRYLRPTPRLVQFDRRPDCCAKSPPWIRPLRLARGRIRRW